MSEVTRFMELYKSTLEVTVTNMLKFVGISEEVEEASFKMIVDSVVQEILPIAEKHILDFFSEDDLSAINYFQEYLTPKVEGFRKATEGEMRKVLSSESFMGKIESILDLENNQQKH